MRKFEDIMIGLHIYYLKKEDDKYSIYLVQDNYNKSLKLIKDTLSYCNNFNITIPKNEEDIQIQVLRGERYNRTMSIEFISTTKPNRGFELTPESALFNWLVY